MRRLVEVVWKVGAGLALLVLTGCGGGGGGGNGGGTGVLTYFADFTPGTAGGPTGVSEVIQIKNSSGKVLGAKTVDNDGSGAARADFTGLPAGKLYLHGTLYSGTKGSGNATGTIDSVFQGASASVLTGKLGQPVSTVVISPSDTSVEVGGKQQFLASALDSNQDLVFEGPAAWSITAGGNFASITSAGLLTGVSLGQTTVQAAYGSVTGSLDVAITSKSGGTWTVMLFLNSANDLDFESPVNMAQIESIAQTATSQTRFVVQWKLSSSPTAQSGIYNHPWNGTRRYLAVHGGAQLIQDLGGGVDMGSPDTLNQFVAWTVNHYPAQHYALIMWDHGNGWSFAAKPATPQPPKWRGISYDAETQHHIDVNQIAGAISPNHLDIISFDACLMQMLEVQDELSSVADYMVCSEDNTPAPGYPYDQSFGQFVTNPTGSVPVLAKGIVDGFFSHYDQDPQYAQSSLSHSVIDLSKAHDVVTALDNLSSAIIGAGGSTMGPIVSSVRQNSLCYDAPEGYFYYDLGSIASRFAGSSAPSSVKSAATALLNADKAAVLYSHSNTQSPDSTGISIEFGNNLEFNQYNLNYAKLKMAAQTHWPQFLGSAALNPAQ